MFDRPDNLTVSLILREYIDMCAYRIVIEPEAVA